MKGRRSVGNSGKLRVAAMTRMRPERRVGPAEKGCGSQAKDLNLTLGTTPLTCKFPKTGLGLLPFVGGPEHKGILGANGPSELR